jgi:1,2-beta-oligoglucan phosphorylase
LNPAGPVPLASPSGLVVQVNANGSLRRIAHRDVTVNAFLGNELEGGPANLNLRRGARIEWIPLLGPRSPGRIRLDATGLDIDGEWSGLRFRVALRLAESAPAWFWHVVVENAGDEAATLDLVHAQDIALADYGTVRLNEYFVSQYVDHTPLVHSARGVANGAPLPFAREPNPYREGGALVAMDALRQRLRDGENLLRIELG